MDPCVRPVHLLSLVSFLHILILFRQNSAFDGRNRYAGSPPSVPYLKALFTDVISAHRIYIERDIATLPLTVATADHTFDVSPFHFCDVLECNFLFLLVLQAHGWNEGRTNLYCSLYSLKRGPSPL